MGKKRTFIDLETGKEFTVDMDNCSYMDYNSLIKKGRFGRKKQYKYFCEHPEEIEDDKTYKLFMKLSKEFKNMEI